MSDSRDGKSDARSAFRRFENAMRKLVRIPKKVVAEKIAAERHAKRPRSKPA